MAVTSCSPEQILSVNKKGIKEEQSFTAEAQTYIFEFDYTGKVLLVKQRERHDSYLYLAEIYYEGV